jgi:hypothetical protein
MVLFSIEKILIFKINNSKNLHGIGDQNRDVQLRHFVATLPRRDARLRDYAAYTYLQFLASALLLHKKYLLLYNVSILLNNLDMIEKCFKKYSRLGF